MDFENLKNLVTESRPQNVDVLIDVYFSENQTAVTRDEQTDKIWAKIIKKNILHHTFDNVQNILCKRELSIFPTLPK
jgi:hypothetical protein